MYGCRISDGPLIMRGCSVGETQRTNDSSVFAVSLISLLFVGRLGVFELSAAVLASSGLNITGFAFLVGLASAMETLCGQVMPFTFVPSIMYQGYNSVLSPVPDCSTAQLSNLITSSQLLQAGFNLALCLPLPILLNLTSVHSLYPYSRGLIRFRL